MTLDTKEGRRLLDAYAEVPSDRNLYVLRDWLICNADSLLSAAEELERLRAEKLARNAAYNNSRDGLERYEDEMK